MVDEVFQELTTVAAAYCQNLLVRTHRLTVREDVPSAVPNLVIAVPSLTTWSRLRHNSRVGQQPVRSMAWPWGLPTLGTVDREKVEEANRCLRHCLSVLGRARERTFATDFLLFHPEDFGRSTTGTPASIWQLRDVRLLANELKLHRSALFQCWSGPSISPAPLGILSSKSHPFKRALRGWPRFVSRQRIDYRGPLPRRCDCGQLHGERSQRRRQRHPVLFTKPFLTSLAQKIFDDHLRQAGLSRQGTASDRGDGQLGCATEARSPSSDESTWEEELISVDSDKGDNITLDDGTEINLSGPMKPLLEIVPPSIHVSSSSAAPTPIKINDSPKYEKSEHDTARKHEVLEIRS